MQQFLSYIQNQPSFFWALIAAGVIILLLVIALIIKTMSYKKPKIKEKTDDFWLETSAVSQNVPQENVEVGEEPIDPPTDTAGFVDLSNQPILVAEDQEDQKEDQVLQQEDSQTFAREEPVEAIVEANQEPSIQLRQNDEKNARLSEKELYDLVEALSSKDEAVALDAVANLKEHCDIRALPYLVAALMLPTLYIPARVGEALAVYGTQASELLLRLIPQISTEGKISALQVLGSMDVVIDLEKIAAYLSDEDAKIRELAIACLGNCQEKAAVDAALEATNDSVWQVRAAAARVLQQRGDPAAYFRLKEMEADEAWWVQEAAKEATHDIEMS